MLGIDRRVWLLVGGGIVAMGFIGFLLFRPRGGGYVVPGITVLLILAFQKKRTEQKISERPKLQ